MYKKITYQLSTSIYLSIVNSQNSLFNLGTFTYSYESPNIIQSNFVILLLSLRFLCWSFGVSVNMVCVFKNDQRVTDQFLKVDVGGIGSALGGERHGGRAQSAGCGGLRAEGHGPGHQRARHATRQRTTWAHPPAHHAQREDATRRTCSDRRQRRRHTCKRITLISLVHQGRLN
jgi:hypothetical protein